MKNLFRRFALPALAALCLISALFVSPPPAHAVGPVMVNLLPIQDRAVASSVTDSNLFWVVQGTSAASYKRSTAAVLKVYMGNTTFTVVDTVSGLTAVVLDTLYCSTSGKTVNCKMLGATGTSNATAHALVPIAFPTAWKPVTAQLVVITQITDTSTVFYARKATVGTNGGVTLTNNGTAFANSGTFTLTAGTSYTYNIQ